MELELAIREEERLAKLKADEKLINDILIEQWSLIALQRKQEQLRSTIMTREDHQGYYMSNGKQYGSLREVPPGQLATYVPVLVGGFKGKKKRVGKKRGRRGRKGGKRRDLVSAGQLGLRNPAVMTKYPPTIIDEWRFEQILETDGAGNFSAYFALRNPTAAVNGSGTYVRAPEFAKLYDEFKVMDLSVVVDNLVLNQINGRTVMAVDFDSIGSGTYTPGDLRDNQYARDFSGTNQISYYSKVVPLSEGTYRGTPAIIHTKGWYDFNDPLPRAASPRFPANRARFLSNASASMPASRAA